jgi:hypothetical protein
MESSPLVDAEIHAHIERHIGAIARSFATSTQMLPHIAIHHVAPTITRPVHTLITSGMSSHAMAVPEGEDAPRFVELMITLPETWALDERAVMTPEWGWPLLLLESLSRRPREASTWLGWGHAVPNGDPPQPYAPNTKLCAAIIVPSLLVPTGFYQLAFEQKSIVFYGVVPLYQEELTLRMQHGMQTLLERMIDKDINDVLDPKRKNVAKRRFGLI